MLNRHIYLASTWENRYELRPVKDTLIAHGHVITSSWVDVGEVDYPRAQGALRDYHDLRRANTLVLWPDDQRKKSTGKYTEFGMAIGWNKDIYIVAPETSTSIFVALKLPNIHCVANFGQLYNELLGNCE